jgi:hypothetical protein
MVFLLFFSTICTACSGCTGLFTLLLFIFLFCIYFLSVLASLGPPGFGTASATFLRSGTARHTLVSLLLLRHLVFRA